MEESVWRWDSGSIHEVKFLYIVAKLDSLSSYYSIYIFICQILPAERKRMVLFFSSTSKS